MDPFRNGAAFFPVDRCPIVEREELAERARRYRFDLRHLTGEAPTYWQEGACWVFSRRELEQWLLPATRTLHDLLMAYVDRVCGDRDLLAWAGVPESWWDVLRRDRRLFPVTPLIRLDFAYDGKGPPKLLECEAEAPGGIFETGFFQLQWFEELARAGELPAGSSQWNRLHDALVAWFGAGAMPGPSLHIAAAIEDSEDWLQARYLAACACQAGQHVRLVDLARFGVDAAGVLHDGSGRSIEQLLMLFRWHHLLKESVSEYLLPALGQGLRLLNPSWTHLLSSKSCLAGLWRMFPDHPVLLPAFLEGEATVDLGPAQVRKPIDGHRGEGIVLYPGDGRRVITSLGKAHSEGAWVLQQFAPQCLMPANPGAEDPGCCVLSSWLVAGRPVALGMREGSDPVLTGSNCRFVPHLVVP